MKCKNNNDKMKKNIKRISFKREKKYKKEKE